jgi:flagella basal body P-ring formation protein FlgA
MGTMLRTFRLTAVAALALGSIPAACSATEAVADSPDVAAARAELLHRLHQVRPDLDRIELTVIGPAAAHSAQVAAGSRVILANAVQSNTLARRMCVWVQRRRAGRSAGSVPVWFSVQAFRSVLVTQRRRNARESLEADDLAVEERDVAALSAIPLALDTDLARVRMRRSVSTGHALLQGDLEETPPILEGQEVVVEVTQGAVAIQTRAVALREARLGERVTLQNPTSHATYTAQVVGAGRAEVVDR